MRLGLRDNFQQKKLLRPTWAEIELKAVEHNYKELKGLAGRHVEILPVVKGDAYGHGMRKISLLLDRLGVKIFGVSDMEEAVELRENGIKKKILLFESTLPSDTPLIVKYDLTPTICTMELAVTLNRYARKAGKRIDVHVEVDTGMGRLGIWHQEAPRFIADLMRLMNLSIKGIYTHFPVAETDRSFTQHQIRNLYRLVNVLDKKGMVIPYIHAANSMGLCGYGTRILNLARPGLMLYGLYPKSELKRKLFLRPVMSVKSTVMFVKRSAKGRSISYGRTFIAKKDMEIATLAIGYRDGYLRSLSNRSSVIIKGERCPVVGRVTMDQIMVDVSRLRTVQLGSKAVILGSQGKVSVTADELASWAGTISYEIVCNLGNRLPRVYIT